MEAHELRRVIKVEPQIVRQQKPAEILAAARQIILARAGDDVFLDRRELRGNIGL
ncbi:hypothetical protein SDC9_113399 [bioreactor metagenome]|uniref:Uncharacterized protein n=1 Tax=bioreactor metagenome TaxID=1076179 RepID=A0A645BMU3_9ZZZZ